MKSKIHELKKNNFKLVSKKFMFSAIAMMAFSFAGLANKIEEKKVEMETIKFVTLDVNSQDPDIADCFNNAITVYHGTISRGKDPEYAIDLAEWVFNDCMEWDIN